MLEKIPDQERHVEFDTLVEKLGGEKGKIRDVASRIRTSTLRGENPDVSEIRRLHDLLAEKLQDSRLAKEQSDEWGGDFKKNSPNLAIS